PILPKKRFVEIENSCRRKRIQRTAEIRHRRRKDRRDNQTGHPVRQPVNYERRKYPVGIRQRSLQRIELVINEQHYSDKQKEQELKKNNKPAQYQCPLAVAHVLAGQ